MPDGAALVALLLASVTAGYVFNRRDRAQPTPAPRAESGRAALPARLWSSGQPTTGFRRGQRRI